MPWQKQEPIFILFEGGEGSGKTTQAHLLYGALKRLGRRVVYNDEPGSTDIGFKIRSVLLEAGRGELDPLTEFLLFEADRSLDFHLNIIPRLENGTDVVQDRCFGSTFAYQGYGRGLIKTHSSLMKMIDKASRRNRYPNIIFLLDGDPKKLLQRIDRRAKKRTSFEMGNLSFHNLIRKGFLAQARQDRKHWFVLDAFQPPHILHKKVFQKVAKLLK